jgi:hypothetical protein
MSFFLSELFLHLWFFNLFLLLNVLSHLLWFLKILLQNGKFFFLFPKNSLCFLLHFFLLLFVCLSLHNLFFEIQLILSKLSVNFVFLDLFPWLSAWNKNNKDIVSTENKAIQMFELNVFCYQISVKIAPRIFTWEIGCNVNLVLFLNNYGLKSPDSHTSDFNVVLWFCVPPSYFSFSVVECVINLSAELRILVKVRKMRFGKVNFVFFLLLSLLFFYLHFFLLSHLVVLHHHVIELELFLCIVKLLEHFFI